jgi:putative Ca2+/H+ antiporter (TMEM165/GDT1 family)
MVFVGVMFALALLTIIGILVGSVISRFVPMKYIKVGSSLVFILFGVLFLFGAITGSRLF